MSSEIAVRSDGLPAKLEYAKFLATSGLLPAQYREKPGNVLYAIEYGEMLGLPAMAAINGVHVIEGKPSASAALVSALVRRAGHRIRTWGNDEEAVTEIVRADDPDFTYRSVWNLDRARKAELLSKANWKKYTAAQLKARSVTECARDACQEVLMGMGYTPDELGVDVDETGLPTPVRASAAAVPSDEHWASKPATAHERATGQPERDWDASIAAAAAEHDAPALRELWRAASVERPGDLDLRERIAAAASAARDATSVTPTPGAANEVHDADVVDDEGARLQEQLEMEAELAADDARSEP